MAPEQTKQFAAASQELSNVARLVQQAGLPYEQDNELRLALRDRLDERVLGALTAEQKAAWRALTGDLYAGFRKEPLTDPGFRGGRFGPGGF